MLHDYGERNNMFPQREMKACRRLEAVGIGRNRGDENLHKVNKHRKRD